MGTSILLQEQDRSSYSLTVRLVVLDEPNPKLGSTQLLGAIVSVHTPFKQAIASELVT